ncbi:hypothetical protein LTS18_014059, partial [Coniosporium uncinatum]
DAGKLQSSLNKTLAALDEARGEVAEKDRVLRSREALLESTGLESRRLSDLLDKERQARKMERHMFETNQRTNQTIQRGIQQTETRVVELETARAEDRRKAERMEQQFNEMLRERNNLLFALWNRLSTLCGQDWIRANSLIDGAELATPSVIARNLPGFSKNLIQSVSSLEMLFVDFKTKIRNVEKTLTKDYQTLEHAVDARIKRLDKLEAAVSRMESKSSSRRSASRASSYSDPNSEVIKLKGENKILKAELRFHQQISPTVGPNGGSGSRAPSIAGNGIAEDAQSLRSPSKSLQAPLPPSMARHHSASAVEMLNAGGLGLDRGRQPHIQQHISQLQMQSPQMMGVPSAHAAARPPLVGVPDRKSSVQSPTLSTATAAAGSGTPSEQRWIHRLKELERRLKAEREARLLDRSGARKRLEEGQMENEQLRAMLEREKEKRMSLESGGVGWERAER